MKLEEYLEKNSKRQESVNAFLEGLEGRAARIEGLLTDMTRSLRAMAGRDGSEYELIGSKGECLVSASAAEDEAADASVERLKRACREMQEAASEIEQRGVPGWLEARLMKLVGESASLEYALEDGVGDEAPSAE